MARQGELGRIGQRRSPGGDSIFFEEFLPELVGNRGIEVYREMSENDDVISAILFAIEMLIRQCEISVEPGGDKKADEEAAKFVESCMHDMTLTWADTLSEILSFIPFGWSYHEIVYKRRMGGNSSKYDDGLIGWKKLPIRAQETLKEWRYADGTDDLLGMVQLAPPDYNEAFIPLEKSLHFRTRSRKDNPEGRSVLRGVYRNWYVKKRLQEIEAIGVERDLAGYPMLQPPEGMDIWDTTDPQMVQALATAERIVQNIRRDELEGLVLPAGWTFSLLNSGSRRQFEVGNIIERYDSRIATAVLADFIFLGQGTTGSFALSSDKTRLFALAIGTYLDIICEVFNKQGIPRLIDLNGDHFKGITDYPKMAHGDVEDANLSKFAEYISTLVRNGVIIPDEELEKFVRKMGNLPPKDDNAELDAADQALRNQARGITEPADGEPKNKSEQRERELTDDKPEVDPEEQQDKEEAEEAKKSLGRKR